MMKKVYFRILKKSDFKIFAKCDFSAYLTIPFSRIILYNLHITLLMCKLSRVGKESVDLTMGFRPPIHNNWWSGSSQTAILFRLMTVSAIITNSSRLEGGKEHISNDIFILFIIQNFRIVLSVWVWVILRQCINCEVIQILFISVLKEMVLCSVYISLGAYFVVNVILWDQNCDIMTRFVVAEMSRWIIQFSILEFSLGIGKTVDSRREKCIHVKALLWRM